MRYCDEEDEEDEEGYHEIDEVLQSSHNVLTLVDLDGHTATKDLQLEEEDILQEDPFADIQGREHYEWYMGNYVCSLPPLKLARADTLPRDQQPRTGIVLRYDLLYRRCGPTNPPGQAVVIVPHDSLFDLFTGYSKASSPVTHLARRCMLPQAQPSCLQLSRLYYPGRGPPWESQA